VINLKIINILFILNLCFSTIPINFNQFKYVKEEINSIDLRIIDESSCYFPHYSPYSNDKNEGFSLIPIFGMRVSQTGFQLDSLNINNTLSWISPGISINYYKPIINPIFPILIYGWSNFYKHSMYGVDYSSTSNRFFNNPDYYMGYYSKSQWETDPLNNGIDFDENIFGLLIQSSFFDFKVGNYSPRIGPFLSSNLAFSGQYPAFSNINLKFYFKNITYNFIIGDLESKILMDSSDKDSFFKPRTVYYHRLDYYNGGIEDESNLRVGIYELLISGDQTKQLSYLNPFSFFWSAQHASGDKDNLLMGMDFEYLLNTCRLYGAFIMDEWSPTKTFTRDNHNWFGYQFGVTKILNTYGIDSSFKFEYTVTSPNLYTHDLMRNLPYHHNYPLGYWNAGNATNFSFYFHSILNENIILYFHYSKDAKGESKYNMTNIINTNLWLKTLYRFGIDYAIQKDLDLGINYNFIISSAIYENNFSGFDILIKYNIDY
tara:strand:+ start:781 stop:2244 length:1464 start_codon:yes stop_codon:yes gene_type:complete